MKAIMDGLLVLPHELVTGQVILYDENIEAIVPRKEFRAGMVTDLIDAEGLIVSPGFINEHIHGCGGFDTMDEDGQALEEMSRLLPSTGVTAFAPTTMTYGRERLEGTLQRIRQAAAQAGGAQILGAHMEGPYISQAYKGAQKGDAIGEADFSWLEPYADVIKIITLAPETLGRGSFLEQCRQHGIVGDSVRSDHPRLRFPEILLPFLPGQGKVITNHQASEHVVLIDVGGNLIAVGDVSNVSQSYCHGHADRIGQGGSLRIVFGVARAFTQIEAEADRQVVQQGCTRRKMSTAPGTVLDRIRARRGVQICFVLIKGNA